ncbi:hypothetical protein CSV79_01540 [Sporosarcina sp. P13]|uniref:tape measure protein n=1 Tax=Sporosarcina sp. P13 TaxID=2048263 RepID=UPI000C16DF4C|nr:tape measure protein [Sporosarcina sp. P13]PIC65332.1 hypothetical protein CSV79_01540 [Sporosarcina sp. P13]
MAGDGTIVIDVILDDGSVVKGVTNLDGKIGKLGNTGEKASLGIGKIVTALGLTALAAQGINMVKKSLDGAINRYDTLNSFPRVMQQMGFDAAQSQGAITKLSKGIDGLPTTLDSIASKTQRIAILTGDLDGAVETTLALNNAFIASGASTADAERGLDQYVQMLSKGEVDLQSWRTLQETMGVALNETANAFGFTGRSAQNDLYDALKKGDITFDEFNAKIIEMSNKTGGFADIAKEASGGIKTSWANMKTAIVKGVTDIIAGIDLALGGVGSIEGIIDGLKTAIQLAFKTIVAAIPPIAEAIQSVYSALVPWLPLLGSIVAGIGTVVLAYASFNSVKSILAAVKKAQVALNASILANPWVLLAAAIIAAVVLAYNKFEWFREGVHAIWDVIVSIVTTTIGNLVAVVGGMADQITAYWTANSESIKSSTTEAWNAIKSSIELALSGVASFVQGVATKIATFWNENGETIKAATKSVWDAIKAVIEFVMPAIQAIIKVAWMAVQFVIEAVWTNIKGVIEGALNIILGLVKTFSSLFTGDWAGVWEGIKQLFIGVIEFLWNAVQLMLWGRMLKGIAVFAGSFRGATTSMWGAVKGAFSSAVEFVKGIFTKGFQSMQSAVNTIMNGISKVISSAWNAIKSVFDNAINAIKSAFKSGFDAIKSTANGAMNAIKTLISMVWNVIKTVFSGSMTAIKNLVTSGFNLIKSTITTIMNAVKSLITTIWNAIKMTVTTATNAIKSVVTSVWNAIKSIITTVMNSVKSVIQAGWNGVKSAITGAVNSIKSAIASGFNAVVSAINSAMSKAVGTVRSMMTQMISAVTGVAGKFLQAGKDLIRGLINGILAMGAAAIDAVAGVVNGVVNKAKNALGIKSPSRVFMAIGDDTMQGFINGLTEREQDVVKVLKDTVHLMLDVAEHYRSEEKKITRTANAEIAELEKRSKEDIDKIHRAAAMKKRKLTKDEAIKVQRIQENTAKKVAEIESKAVSDSVELMSKEQADKLKELKLFVEDKKSLNELSAQEEVAVWERSLKFFVAGTKERVEVQKNYNKAVEILDKERLSSVKTFIEDKKSLDQLSLKDEAAIWEEAVKLFKDGTKEKIEAQKNLKNALEAIDKDMMSSLKSFIDEKKTLENLSLREEAEIWAKAVDYFREGTEEKIEAQKSYVKALGDLNKEIADTNKFYADQITKINEDLQKSEEEITAAYTKSLDDREKALFSFSGIFDEFKAKTESTGTELLSNLRGQVDGFKDWQESITTLSERAIDDGLLEELRAMGPKAAGEIAALNKLTDEQLTEYSDLYREKQALARQQAEKELIGMKQDTADQISSLRKVANEKLDEVKSDWQKRIQEITSVTSDKLKELETIGREAGQGLLKGFQSEREAIVAEAESIANAIKYAMANALDIHSPSRWMRDFIAGNMGKGFIIGIDKTKSSIVRKAGQMVDWMKPEIPQTNFVNKLRGVSAPIRGVMPINLSGGSGSGSNTTTDNSKSFSPNITNHFTRVDSSPSESARKQEQMLRRLALDY